MKILILSDTHGHLDDRIIYYTKKVDQIWHAGDIGSIELIKLLNKNVKVKAVYGNIDGVEIRSSFNEYLSFFCEKISVLLIHIAGKPLYYNKETNKLILKKGEVITSLILEGNDLSFKNTNSQIKTLMRKMFNSFCYKFF